MNSKDVTDILKQLAKGLAEQFGSDCEVIIQDAKSADSESTIIAIENGHVTQRKVGDGPSSVVLKAQQHNDEKDQLNYYTKTMDGRVLRSSTMYIRDEVGVIDKIFCINYDITNLVMAETTIKKLINYEKSSKPEPKVISKNINELLDDLIESAVAIIGKPVAMMSKDDKIKAMQFLNDAGAFLITKSGDKVSHYFGISKFTLYNYIDIKQTTENS